ncbi:hypothetical protein PG990_001586 [Apiospora arundinis]|uniref:Uncharacterized protein n=1 Tax=Apiospora arundinis TaxID=335852 RepID=A0ABR2HSY5_9PEZI
MDSTPTRSIGWSYESLNDIEKSALESMLQHDNEVLPPYIPEDSHMHSLTSTTHTIEWPSFNFNCWSKASFDVFTDWPKSVMNFDSWCFNMETSPSNLTDSPFDIYGAPFCPGNWSIDFSDIDNWPLDHIDGSGTHAFSNEASRDDVAQEAIPCSPYGEPSELGPEMTSCQEEPNKLGKRSAYPLETQSQTQVLPKRRKTRSPAAPRKRIRSSRFNFSVDEVERQSQAYKPVPRRCGKTGQWKDFNGKIMDGKLFRTSESEVAFKIRPNGGYMPVWMYWDKQEGWFRGDDIDGHTMVVDRDTMFAAISEGPGCFVGELVKG